MNPRAGVRRELVAGFSLLVALAALLGSLLSEGADPPVQHYAGTLPVVVDKDGRIGVCDEFTPPCRANPIIIGLRRGDVREADGSPARFAYLRVTVHTDGRRLVLDGAPQPGAEDDLIDHFGTPCDPPAGGWTRPVAKSVGPSLEEVLENVPLDGVARYWTDSEAPDGTEVYNFAFVDDLARHEAEIREFWDGPLCISEGTREIVSLVEAAERMRLWSSGIPGGEHTPPRMAWCCGVDEARGAVRVFSLLGDEAISDWVRRHARGVPVYIDAYLRPVD